MPIFANLAQIYHENLHKDRIENGVRKRYPWVPTNFYIFPHCTIQGKMLRRCSVL
ncbi:hypothetical protein JHK82_026689 [Glycine max]|nr:hypothetical protein JHK87_026570 [Glycine soja]KAG4995869.1 hypothetical protein JHK85_027308 [Glycine max]KAG5125854.1 hypothetical protein JHK82_026689 [Glycine max]KHN03743.1 hypothetical protein glysoja_010972 [Glycine soja]